ncbi:MAG: hypothetical protein K2W96_08705 [Gemmataceae bacterium]|nr:hypothetical protein [Gemmataceae bacterium]
MSRTLLAAAFLAFALSAHAADKGKKKPPAAVVKQDNVLVAELRHAFRVLDLADPIYSGHRAKARAEINRAIAELEKEMKKRGLKAHHKKDAIDLPDRFSDALLRETARELATVMKQIAGLPSTPHRAAAAKHVAKAVGELESALAAPRPKGSK